MKRMTDEDSSLPISAARAVEQRPTLSHTEAALEHLCTQPDPADPPGVHTEGVLLSPHQALCCSPLQLSVPHHPRAEPPLPACRGRQRHPVCASKHQESRQTGTRATQALPDAAGNSPAAVCSGTASPELSIAGWAQPGCLQPRTTSSAGTSPAAFRTAQTSQPGTSHHPHPLHLRFCSHPCKEPPCSHAGLSAWPVELSWNLVLGLCRPKPALLHHLHAALVGHRQSQGICYKHQGRTTAPDDPSAFPNGAKTDETQLPRVLNCCYSPNSQENPLGLASNLELDSQKREGIIMSCRPAVAGAFWGSQATFGDQGEQSIPLEPSPHLLPLSCSSANCKTKWLEMCRVL